ncbi:hypothetical protein PF010_g28191 [Phytophthora fragariae]|uniref:RxLR effector protein n=1 Tax=Phytophthora fragariae TaxID=53985 RepID=A0A6G0MJ90_9STRA|nr:hypothetical protein PF010_g28191 [Phytophthora fragariae]KAE9168912.1 hypothetical protein PF004_g28355 [Phytophthora fragariae]
MTERAKLVVVRYFLALLVVIAASTTAAVATDSTRTAPDAFVHEQAVVQRRLRVGNSAEEAGNEERVNSLTSLQFLHSGQSVDDVSKLLKLENPDQATSLVKTFTAAYGDDVVAKMLQVAKQDPSMAARVVKLQAQQMRVWRREQLTPDDVFKLLKLDQAASNPLSNVNLNAWTANLNLFNFVNPGRETTMIKTFTRAYGDEQLARMLEAANAVPGTENIVKSLQAAQFNRWMMIDGNPDRIYIRVFKLDPKAKTIPEPYQSILNQYHNFYKSYSKVK